MSHDWGFVSEPDETGHSIPLPRGRLVGGCSATNAAVAVRGAPSDYDRWAELGAWRRLLEMAQGRGVELGMAFLDGTSIRAQPKAAGAPEKILWVGGCASRVGFE